MTAAVLCFRPVCLPAVFDSRQTAGVYWATGPVGTARPYRLSVQNDGNVVIYNGLNSATWATNTVGR